ncbi:MAG: bifunctional folylpolyglutamate synthase/dihydrofolate synthase [Clostridia bacterium]|nr:bifunctional folylpolyglutamate synthase/dihydrofolate synthase [Clostridia bacterium]
MNRDEAIKYIHTVSWKGSVPGLGRIRELCRLLGDPQDGLRFIHVAGTNGKGSVSAMLSSILRAAGYKTGLFTSPYVSFFEERIVSDGEPIPGDALGRVTERVRAAAETMKETPTEFELLTAVGFEYFREERCDVVVLETGLGGRLDSTNVIGPPVLSVITGIGLDHTAILGDTEKKIAREKAGIIKKGSAAVAGKMSGDALSVIKKRAEAVACPLYAADPGRISAPRLSPSGTEFTDERYGELFVPLAGVHQLDNAATVLTAADALARAGFCVTEDAVRRGLRETRWPARFETLAADPLVIYDGAHNPDGVEALTENVRLLLGGRAVIVFGVMADKSYEEMIKTAATVAERVYTVRPDNPRSLDPAVSAELFDRLGAPARSCGSVGEGISLAGEEARERGLPVVIMGTLYMYAEASDEVRRLFGRRTTV